MKKTQFIELVNKNFDFLFRDYGFLIVPRKRHPKAPQKPEEDRVFLQSKECKIDILLDRAYVMFYFGPNYVPVNPRMTWYDLTHILSFITQGPNQVDLDYCEFNKETDSIDDQMKHIRLILEPYIKDIINLFKEENFKIKQKDLDEFIKKLAEDRWGKTSGT